MININDWEAMLLTWFFCLDKIWEHRDGVIWWGVFLGQYAEPLSPPRTDFDIYSGKFNWQFLLQVPEVAAEAGDSDDDAKGKKRRKKGRETPESEEEGSEDDKPKRGKKKAIFNFTEAEVRKFVKSFRKFAEPLTRYFESS